MKQFEPLLPLIDAWRWELTVAVEKARQHQRRDPTASERGLGDARANFLESVSGALGCLERAISGERSENPLSRDP